MKIFECAAIIGDFSLALLKTLQVLIKKYYTDTVGMKESETYMYIWSSFCGCVHEGFQMLAHKGHGSYLKAIIRFKTF